MESTYEMELIEAACLAVKREEYPVPVPRIEERIRAKAQEIGDLKNEKVPRPATKIEYVNLLSQLEAQKADLVAENDRIFADNQAARKSVDDKYAADIAAEKEKPELKWVAIRAVRNNLLQKSDWTVLPDSPTAKILTAKTTLSAWKTYRQALRDIPQTFADPDKVEWPEAPK